METTEFKEIFNKFGRGAGSYLLIPGNMDMDNYYNVNLVVLAENGQFEIFKISLFEKKSMVFRLEKKSMKTKDFSDMDKLLKYLEHKEGLKFTYPIQRNHVELKSHHKINSIVFIEPQLSFNYPKAKALYDYETKENGADFMTLCFKKGDIINVTDKIQENGWWQGQIGDAKGMFPSNFVQIIDNEEEKVNENMIGIYINDDIKENEQNNCFLDDYGNDLSKMNGPTLQFYNFLSDLRLNKYFENFQNYECSDIALIDCFTDDHDAEDLLKNDVGIRNKVHRKKLIKAFKNLEQKMDAFRRCELIPSFLVQKLAKYGIVTMDILCLEIETKADLNEKAKMKNQSHCDLLWNIIENQRRPKPLNERKRSRGKTLSPKSKEVEGYGAMTPPPIPKVPSEDVFDVNENQTTKGGQPGHRSLFSKDVDDIEVNSPVPAPPPPVPPVPEYDDDDDNGKVIDPIMD